MDCSVLFVRDPGALRAAFSLVPDYLVTAETEVTNLMDLGVQLGRRFRALKLWMVIRAFGVEGLRDAHPRALPVGAPAGGADRRRPRLRAGGAGAAVGAVCFRALGAPGAAPAEQDRFNERLVAEVNRAGRFFLSSTVLAGRVTPRVAIGNIRTTEAHLDALWELLRATAHRLRAEGGAEAAP